MQQIDLLERLERDKDRAVYAAGAFADPLWKREAIATLETLCKLGDNFTTDDVWRLLEGVGVKTPEPRALGALITRYAKEGRIFSTGSYRKSIRKECHRRPLAVWRPTRRNKTIYEEV
jgi:hypothetical protein